MKIAFFGLGQMGRPIALNLLASGAELAVHARSTASAERLAAHGLRSTAQAQEAVAGAEFIFLCLPDGEATEQLLLGSGGLVDAIRTGQCVIDLGTSHHAITLRLAKALASRGIDFMDAPVSGMQSRAEAGTLTVMCGSTPETFERVQPLLAHIGSKVLHMGPVGSGQLTKLVNQLLFDINAAALAEILPMAVKLGLDPVQVGEVINSGTGRSHASAFFVPRILRRHFSDGYPMAHAYKDLVSGAELGASRCIPMPVLAAATATYQAALLRGHGADDKGGMIKVHEALLGVEVASPPAARTPTQGDTR